MSTRHRQNSPDRIIPARVAATGWRILLGALALAMMTGVQAYVTVGPHGTYATIQGGVNQALANGGDEVRVEVKLCTDVHGFQYVCPFKENLAFAATHSITLSGGWASDFVTPTATRTWIQGGGANQDTILVTASTPGVTTTISAFDVNGSGTTPQYNTRGIRIVANTIGVAVNVSGNTVRNNAMQTLTISSGGGGIFALAGGGANVSIHDNEFQNNSVLGLDTAATYGGAAWLSVSDGSQLAFENNAVTGNAISNPSGGGCHGGAVWAEATGAGAQLTLSGNTSSGNQQFGCTSGSTGDAAEIHATGGAVIQIASEAWLSNSTVSNPGVYEVFMHADNFANIYAGNGLITHGTWGGLYAQTDATAIIKVVNFTIADNPVLGFNGVGPGTQLWNAILWNDGSPLSTSGGATANSILENDPAFVDSASGNYRLTAGSPAINAGTNVVPNATFPTDLDGSPRPYAGDCRSIADIGAYEFHAQGDRIFCSAFEL